MANTEVIPANDASRMPAVTDSTALIAMIERAARDPAMDMDKMDRLLVMHERMMLAVKEQAFNDAMAEAQAEMEPIRRDCNNPQTSSKYASYAALDRTVRPIYSKHGFGVSFNTQAPRSGKPEIDIGVVAYVTCRGFTRLYEIDMPADGKGARGADVMTRTHATGSGLTYGRRYLLQMIFNLATETQADDDGNAAGGRPAPRQQQQRKPDPAPIDTSKPHKLVPLVGDTFEAWIDRFVAHVDTAMTYQEGAEWEALNTEVIGKIHAASTPNRPLIGKVDDAFARCKERVAKLQHDKQAKSAPAEPAGEPSDEPPPKATRTRKASDEPPAAAGERFPEPWIKQTPDTYVAWAEAWLNAAPNQAVPTSKAIDDRWDAERKIRNGLADKVPGPSVEHLVELKGAAKARAKANPWIAPATQEMPATMSRTTETEKQGDGKPHTTVNPEGFIKWVTELYASATTLDDLEKWHNLSVEVPMAHLLPPDQEEIMRLYRRREGELTP